MFTFKMFLIFAYATMLAPPTSVLAPLDGIHRPVMVAFLQKSGHFSFSASKVDYAQAAGLIDSSPHTNVTSSSSTVADVPFRVLLRVEKPSPPLRLPEYCASANLPQAISIEEKNLPVMLKLPNMTYHTSAPAPAPTRAPTCFAPSLAPTPAPTFAPARALVPTYAPTFAPSLAPTPAPTFAPARAPVPTAATTFAPALATTSASAPSHLPPRNNTVPPADNKPRQARIKDTKKEINRFFIKIFHKHTFARFFIAALSTSIILLVEFKLLHSIIQTIHFTKTLHVRKESIRSSLSPFIRSDGTLRINVAPASGSPSQGYEAFLISHGTGDCSSSMPKKDSRPLPLQQGKVKKRWNRTEVDIAYRKKGFLFVFDRRKYKDWMPPPLPVIQEEPADSHKYNEGIPPPLPVIQEKPADEDSAAKSHAADPEVAPEDEDVFPAPECQHDNEGDENEVIEDTAPDPYVAEEAKLGRGTRVDAKGRLVHFSYRLKTKPS